MAEETLYSIVCSEMNLRYFNRNGEHVEGCNSNRRNFDETLANLPFQYFLTIASRFT